MLPLFIHKQLLLHGLAKTIKIICTPLKLFKINTEEILNKEFVFYIYSSENENFVEYFPKVDDVLIGVLLSRVLQNHWV